MTAPFPTRADGVTLRQAEPSDFDAIVARDEQAFGSAFEPAQLDRVREAFVFERFVVAIDGDDLVGVAGSFDFELSLPGGASVPMAGTTWVSVAPTHRRRGITRDMLGWVHADATERGCVAAGLQASEGSIYERFGYGVATTTRFVRIDARRARFTAPSSTAGTSTRLVDAMSSVAAMHERYERMRRITVGELSQSPQWLADRVANVKHPQLALHEDGYALWRVDADWGPDGANHTLHVVDLVAATAEAHRDLWELLLSVDLIARIEARSAVRIDDPLPWFLVDPRVVSTIGSSDFLWLLPLDARAVLAARRYRVPGEFVVEIRDRSGDNERWRLSGSIDEASCDATADAPDVTMSRAALGALLLGGTSASELASGGRLDADASILGALDAFFGWSPAPHCTTDF